MTGYVTKMNPERLFGFILGEQDKKEYFFHRDDYDGDFQELMNARGNTIKVIFEPTNTPKGLRAKTISKWEAADA